MRLNSSVKEPESAELCQVLYSSKNQRLQSFAKSFKSMIQILLQYEFIQLGLTLKLKNKMGMLF